MISEVEDVVSGYREWSVIHGPWQSVLPFLPDGAADHFITDPPYEEEAHTLQRRALGEVERGKGRKVEAVPLSFAPISTSERDAFGAQVARLSSRWGLIFCQVEAAMIWRKSLEPMVYRRSCPWVIPAELSGTGGAKIWVKPDGQPQLSGDRPGMGYETIVTVHQPGRSRWNGGGKLGVFTHNKTDPGQVGRNLHPTQKPIALMLELVELFTDPGDLVIDPFCGSGTTGAACIRLGRRFLGIELDRAWADLSRERLAAEEKGLCLRDARAGQFSMFGKPVA